MIDWEAEWREGWRRRPRLRGASEWSKRASSPTWHASDSDFPEQVIDILRPEPDWTVLDVGCGTGTLAVPIAGRVRAVTAIDYAEGMIAGLRERCERERVTNVAARLAGWQDDWDALGIGTHDLAIASRSLIVEDLGGALLKLDRAARRRVCVVPPVGDGPHDRRVFDAVGRPFIPRVDYLTVYGRLYELGIHANVNVITRHDRARYDSPEQAAAALSWMLPDPSDAEMDALRSYTRASLVEAPEGWRFPSPRDVRWAVIWWDRHVGVAGVADDPQRA